MKNKNENPKPNQKSIYIFKSEHPSGYFQVERIEIMKDRHVCWTCKRAGMSECSWDKCGEPVEGWVATEHKFPNEKYDSYTVTECPLYIYDGECVNCVRNENHIAECLYNSCSYFNKQRIGTCACEQWAIVNQGRIWNDEQANKHSHYERVMATLRR